MQNKKRVGGRTSGKLAIPKVSRLQKKVSENMQVEGTKVTELITSSVRKQKTGKISILIHLFMLLCFVWQTYVSTQLELFQKLLRSVLLQQIWILHLGW